MDKILLRFLIWFFASDKIRWKSINSTPENPTHKTGSPDRGFSGVPGKCRRSYEHTDDHHTWDLYYTWGRIYDRADRIYVCCNSAEDLSEDQIRNFAVCIKYI